MRISIQHLHHDETRMRLGHALHRVWRHHAIIVPLYRGLAPHMEDEGREILLQQLAEREEQHLQTCANRLARLRVPVPKTAGALTGVWYWLLLRSSAPPLVWAVGLNGATAP